MNERQNCDIGNRIKNIKASFVSDSERTKKIVQNVSISLVTKIISILCSLLIVPLTINYVNPTRYGIWLALCSVVEWFTFFNLGLTNGFRNKFAESLAKGDKHLAKQYVSTTYVSLGFVATIICIIGLTANMFVDWANVLNIDEVYYCELKKTFAILLVIFCFSLVVKVFSLMIIADQRPGLSSIFDVVGQILSLGAIFLLTKTTNGSLLNLALYYSSIPCFVILCASVFYFKFSQYKEYAPSFKMVKLSLVKDIVNLGWKFFVININLLIIFQLVNVFLSREAGPESVTLYNLSYKYFNIIYMVAVIVLTPYWSAFTDAYIRKDYAWMKQSLKTLERLCAIAAIFGGIMLMFSSWFYRVWLGESVIIPFKLSAVVFAYVMSSVVANVYMYLINGIGTIKLQLITYICYVVISVPLLIYSCRYFGVYGAVISPMVIYVIQAILGKIQIDKLLSQTAYGLWAK